MSNPSITEGPRWIRAQSPWLRIFIFLLILGLIWAPIGLSVYSPMGYFSETDDAEIVALICLYAGFLCGLPLWSKRIHRWWRPFARCGLIAQTQTLIDAAIALLIGTSAVFALFGFETVFGWAQYTPPSPKLLRFIVEGLLMAIAVGFAEEMLFRGWILAELETSYRSAAALLSNALFFAGTHFIRPLSVVIETLPQFFGLFVLGLLLVWARRTPTGQPAQTRIGYPIGLHAGLIWGYYIVKVGGLSEPTGIAPEWLTGIDGNPLAGLAGIIFLSLICRPFARLAKPQTQ